MNPLTHRIAQRIARTLDPEDVETYIDGHYGTALEVSRNNGAITDMDNMVALADTLGHEVSYDLYQFVNGRVNEGILQLCEDKDHALEVLAPLIERYAGNRERVPSAIVVGNQWGESLQVGRTFDGELSVTMRCPDMEPLEYRGHIRQMRELSDWMRRNA